MHTVTELERNSGLKKKEFSELIRENSIAESTEIFCLDCETPYCFHSRADFQEQQRYLKYKWRSEMWVCKECSSEREKREQEEKAEKLEQFKNLIAQRYSSKPNVVDINLLSLEDVLYLISLCRLCADEDFLLAKPLGSMSFHTRLSPDSKYDYDILRQLYHKQIVRVSADSPINAFEGEEAETFYLDRVFWILPINELSGSPKSLISELEGRFKNNDLLDHWQKERLELWKKIALRESLEFLAHQLNERGLTLNPGEKTVFVINTLLEDFSVSQIYNFIYRAVINASDFMVRKGVNKQHAANTVIGAMQRYGETAKIQGYTVKSFRRNFECQQTMISQVFFDVILRIGESGFFGTPQIYDNSNSFMADEIDEIQ